MIRNILFIVVVCVFSISFLVWLDKSTQETKEIIKQSQLQNEKTDLILKESERVLKEPDHWAYTPTHQVQKLDEKFKANVTDIAKTIYLINKGNTFPSNKLLLAIAATESSFRLDAQSSSSVGLMQINYSAHNLEKEKMFNINKNVKQAIKVLKKYHHRCNGDLKCTLISYNVGFTGYKKGRGSIKYYNKVMSYM